MSYFLCTLMQRIENSFFFASDVISYHIADANRVIHYKNCFRHDKEEKIKVLTKSCLS